MPVKFLKKGSFATTQMPLSKSVWEKHKFDENLTGCEDMELAKRLCADGGKIGYVAEASVFHIHDETWRQVKTRYEREAVALQKLCPKCI